MPNLHNRFKSAERKISQENKPDRDGPGVGPLQNCVRQPRPLFKMAVVTKNRNFFNCPLLLIRINRLKEIFHRKTGIYVKVLLVM
jgi:hypothetical protein